MPRKPRTPEQKARRAARDAQKREDKRSSRPLDPAAVERESNSGWLIDETRWQAGRDLAIAPALKKSRKTDAEARQLISDAQHTKRLKRVLQRKGIYSEEGHRLAQLGLELERLGALADLAAVRCALADLRRGGAR